jgi:hypothetical protein
MLVTYTSDLLGLAVFLEVRVTFFTNQQLVSNVLLVFSLVYFYIYTYNPLCMGRYIMEHQVMFI